MIRQILFLSLTMHSSFWGASSLDALYQKAMEACRARDFRTCGQLLLQAAEDEHPQAQARLAQMYQRGIGTKVDSDKADYWSKRYKKNLATSKTPSSFVLPPAPDKQAISQRLVDQAEMYLERGEWSKAMGHAQASLHIEPTPYAHILELEAMEKAFPEQYLRIDSLYRKTIESNPAPELLQRYAFFLMRYQDYSPAIQHFNKTINGVGPLQFQSYLGLAECYFHLKDLSKAKHYLQLAEAQEPNHSSLIPIRSLIKNP